MLDKLYCWQQSSVNVLKQNSHFNIILHATEYFNETVEHFLIFITFYLLICIILYLGMTNWKVPAFTRGIKSSKRILLITAHPDDECMFFGPTVLNLIKTGHHKIHILCLSTGSHYGMGRIRKHELLRACNILGIKNENITVKNHSLLPDNINVHWPIEVVQKIILHHMEVFDIDTIITFDKHGVSNHPNHRSIFYAVAGICLDGLLPNDCSVYVLETVSILRKYSLIFEIPISFLLSRTRYFVQLSDREVIHQAMKEHKSQLVWFRWLYMYFSRYMLINTLYQLDLDDIQLDMDLEL